MKLGLFGGSFDPIHNGHLRPAQAARRALGLDRVLVVPTANPPHKRAAEDAPRAGALARYAMVEIALLDQEGLFASAHELRLERPSYTVETLEHFRAERPEDELYLLLGSDSLAALPTWRRWEEIPALARLVVLARPGWRLGEIGDRLAPALAERLARGEITLVQDALVDLSSREIRNRLARGEPLDDGWLPPRVVDYIYKYCLYS